MKKQFMLAIGLVVAVSSVSLVSCKDEDDEPGSSSNTCSCTEYDPYMGSYTTRDIDPSTFGESNCSDLADKFNSYSYESGTTMTCHKK